MAEVVHADTLPDLLASRVSRTPLSHAFFVERDGQWHGITWNDFAARVARLAAAFAARGLRAGDRLGIIAPTSLGWELAQFAAFHLGATVVGIDPHLPHDEAERLVKATRVCALALGSETALPSGLRGSLHSFRFVVATGERELTWPSIHTLNAGEGHDVAARPGADDAALIAFSSGTTGRPQPVVYTHAQVLLAATAIVELYPEVSDAAPLVSWLPLANLFQRMINYCGVMRGLPSYLLEDPRRVMDVLPIARPEVIIAVPRFCNRVRAGVLQQVAGSRLRRSVWRAAYRLARVRARKRSRSASARVVQGLAWRLADRAVMRRVRRIFGRRLKFIVSGSAPMPPDLLEWFDAIGLPVLEAYGISENIVPVAASRLSDRVPGTVGRPLRMNDVRIVDGEVLVRGPGVLLPTLGENRDRASAVDAAGFLHTGDVAELDADGYLRLRGRKRETFKTPDGRWVSPADVEAALTSVKGVEHAAAFRSASGDMLAVLTLAHEVSDGTAAHPSNDDVPARIHAELTRAIAALPASARPRACLFVRQPFTIDGGELTTNLKIRRTFIAEKYRDRLEALVAEPAVAGAAAIALV
jgi:long-chain acyl-CoA synthetase